jgi:hypothetical protein
MGGANAWMTIIVIVDALGHIERDRPSQAHEKCLIEAVESRSL